MISQVKLCLLLSLVTGVRLSVELIEVIFLIGASFHSVLLGSRKCCFKPVMNLCVYLTRSQSGVGVFPKALSVKLIAEKGTKKALGLFAFEARCNSGPTSP